MFDVPLCSFIKILYDIVSGKNYDLCGKNYYMVSAKQYVSFFVFACERDRFLFDESMLF